MNFLKDQIQTVDSALGSLRDLITRNQPKAVKVPLSAIDDSDLSSMEFVQGEWTMSPWNGLRWMLTHTNESTKSKYVLCEAMIPVDLGAHLHSLLMEEVVMMEGCMDDLVSGQRIYPGIRYKIPIGETHWPVFPGPALFMVIFREGPSSNVDTT